jgi:hypothetical protein
MLFYDTLGKNSKNLREYELLKLKVRKIGYITSNNFKLLLSKEKNSVQSLEEKH